MTNSPATWSGSYVEENVGVEVGDAEQASKLFGLALRKNPRRYHLLVSKVLGKHIPANPKDIDDAARKLGEKILSTSIIQREAKDKNRRFTVFGYAETATLLASLTAIHVASAAKTETEKEVSLDPDRVGYINSTRYPRSPEDENMIYDTFSEGHSHAVNHYITPINSNILFDNPNTTIILVDDEITTGKTILNTISMFERHHHHDSYVVGTLVDSRNSGDRQKFREFEKNNNLSIEVVSLMQANITVPDSGFKAASRIIDMNSVSNTSDVVSADEETQSPELLLDHTFNAVHLKEGELTLNRLVRQYRADLSLRDVEQVEKTVGDPSGKKILFLGIEEDMLFPYLYARSFSEKYFDGNTDPNIGVFFSSTTLSPVQPINDPGYAIRFGLGYQLSGKENDVPRFVYNVDGSFDTVYICAESERIKELNDLYRKIRRTVKNVRFVSQGVHSQPIDNNSYKARKFSSYGDDDVTWLLTDLTGITLEGKTEEREKSIQSGKSHYAESLPIEYTPSDEYMKLFNRALKNNSKRVAEATAIVSGKILAEKGRNIVLVSLARAGTPAGILIKRHLEHALHLPVPHYTISIVRGRGVDINALHYISRHHNTEDVVFVDGWTGKGAISTELMKSVEEYNEKFKTAFSSDLAVIADPGSCTPLYGTRDDYLIPSACLNSTVSGLVSRTVLNSSLLHDHDFHGAKSYYRQMHDSDQSLRFIENVEKQFSCINMEDVSDHITNDTKECSWDGWASVKKMGERFGIDDMNLIKPGVGETTRVLLRRVPWKVVYRPRDKKDVEHILMLAHQRGVELIEDDSLPYACYGIIKPQNSHAPEAKMLSIPG